MINRIKSGSVVVLSLWLITGEVRADCLDGYLEYSRIDRSASADTHWAGWCLDDWEGSPTEMSGQAECHDFCLDEEQGLWLPCGPGPAAEFTVTATPNGYTITAHAEVHPHSEHSENPHFQAASAYVFVQPAVVGGEVVCTVQGADKYVDEGVVTVTPIEAPVPDPEEPTCGTPVAYGLYCAAWGSVTGGSVDCTLTVTCTPTVCSDSRSWNDPNGGSYQDSNNWDDVLGAPQSPHCAPAHDPPQRSDDAYFTLSSASFIPVSGSGATANQWVVTNGCPIEFTGSGQVFSTWDTIWPSLRIGNGGQLRLASGGSLDSVHASVGASGATNSLLEVNGASWTNTESTKIGRGSVDVLNGGAASTKELRVGAGNGPGAVRVTGDGSTVDVADHLIVGDVTPGTVDIDHGWFSVTPVTLGPQIGNAAAGTVTVRGDDSNLSTFGRFDVHHSLVVGNGASGRLNVQRGGHARIDLDLLVSAYGSNPSGEVVVDGQGGIGMLDVFRIAFIGATELQEILVHNGGRLSADELNIGYLQVRPGTADVTLRGPSGSFPTLTVGTGGGGGMGTFVGDQSAGQLNIEAGAIAELYGGLFVGDAAQGIVMVSELNAPPGTYTLLTVTGETQVGIGAPGILHIDDDASVVTNGNMRIGLGTGNPSGTVNVYAGSSLDVNGTLSVGDAGVGLLNIVAEPNTFPAHVYCDTLLVGGNTFGATGIITASYLPNAPVNPHFSHLTVYGNAQVGVGVGRGEILLADPSGRLEINGTMTIGNPGGGPGGGAVVLVDALIEGTGNIVVNKNGSMSGTGTISVSHINAGGIISPGLSPGTLLVDGDLDMLPDGALIIEYNGLNPGEFDVLHVTGQTTLGGRLEVHFRDGYSPLDPAAFIVSQYFIETEGAVIGDYHQRIYAFPDEFADFDDDDDKDLSDVASFQSCFGLSGGELEPACGRADWENDGVLNEVEVRELTARLSGPQ